MASKSIKKLFQEFTEEITPDDKSVSITFVDAKVNVDVEATARMKAESEIRDVFEEISSDIEDEMKEKLTQVIEPLTQALNEAMSHSWGWSEGSRDIIDTGALMNSLRIEVNDNKIEIYYDSPYASLVHNGGYIMPYGNDSIEKVYIPSRPWIDAVMNGGGPVPQFIIGEYLQ